MSITIPNSSVDLSFNISELTSGTLDGNGVFDVLMKAVYLHLEREYEDNRIRGTDYANAYIQLMQNGLQQATGYSLQKAKLPLELQLLEAEIQKVATDTIVATKQGGLLDAQAIHEMSKNRQTEYITNIKLPKEVALIDANIRNQDKQTALLEFELTYLKPKELELKQQQIELAKAEVELKLKQIPLMEKELELKEKQVAIAEKELGIKEQQLALAKFELEFKAPAEVKSINAQGDLYNQKVITEKAQTDPSVIGTGSVIDVQNKLHEKQKDSYDRDAEQKVLSILVETWKVRHNADPDFEDNAVNAINKLNNHVIGKAVEKASTGIGLVV